MSFTIRKISSRLRSKQRMSHKPNGHGHGKWHSRTTLWNYKMAARRRRLMANESRRRNRR